MITVKAVQAKAVSSISKVQPGVKPGLCQIRSLINTTKIKFKLVRNARKNQQPKNRAQRLWPPATLEVLDSSAVLSIDKEEYYVDSFNVIETEEFAIEENEFTLDTFPATDCSPSRQPRLMNTELRQVSVDCPLETSFPLITVSMNRSWGIWYSSISESKQSWQWVSLVSISHRFSGGVNHPSKSSS